MLQIVFFRLPLVSEAILFFAKDDDRLNGITSSEPNFIRYRNILEIFRQMPF